MYIFITEVTNLFLITLLYLVAYYFFLFFIMYVHRDSEHHCGEYITLHKIIISSNPSYRSGPRAHGSRSFPDVRRNAPDDRRTDVVRRDETTPQPSIVHHAAHAHHGNEDDRHQRGRRIRGLSQ